MKKGMKHPLTLKPKVRKDGTLQHYWIDPSKDKVKPPREILKDMENEQKKRWRDARKAFLEKNLPIKPHDKMDEIYLRDKVRGAFDDPEKTLDELKNKLPKLMGDDSEKASDEPKNKSPKSIGEDPSARIKSIFRSILMETLKDRSKIELVSNNKQQTVKDKLFNDTTFRNILNKELKKIDTNKLKKELINDTASSMKSIIDKSHLYSNISPLHKVSKEEYNMVKKNIQKSLDKYNKNMRRKNLFGSQIADHIFSPDTVTSVGNIIRTHFRDSDFLDAMDHLRKLSEKYPDSSSTDSMKEKIIDRHITEIKEKLSDEVNDTAKENIILAKIKDYLTKTFLLSPKKEARVLESAQSIPKNSKVDTVLLALDIVLQTKAAAYNYIPPKSTSFEFNIPNMRTIEKDGKTYIESYTEIVDNLLPQAPFTLEDITDDLISSWQKITGEKSKPEDFMLNGDDFTVVTYGKSINTFLIYRKWLNDYYFKLKTKSLDEFNKAIRKEVGDHRRLLQLNAVTNKEFPVIKSIGKLLSDADYGVFSNVMFDDALIAEYNVDDLKSEIKGGKK